MVVAAIPQLNNLMVVFRETSVFRRFHAVLFLLAPLTIEAS